MNRHLTHIRHTEILKNIDAWVQDTQCTVKDALFALYNDRMITGHELDQMMDKIDLEMRMLTIARQWK